MARQKAVLTNGSPLVRQFVKLANERDLTWYQLEVAAGLGADTIRFWRQKLHDPQLSNFQAALHALGYELRIVPIGGERCDIVY